LGWAFCLLFVSRQRGKELSRWEKLVASYTLKGGAPWSVLIMSVLRFVNRAREAQVLLSRVVRVGQVIFGERL